MGVVNRTHRSWHRRPALLVVAGLVAILLLVSLFGGGQGTKEEESDAQGSVAAAERTGSGDPAGGPSTSDGGLDLDLRPVQDYRPGDSAPGDAPAGSAVTERARTEMTASPPAPKEPAASEDAAALQSEVERIIANSVAKAEEESKGNANGGNCAVAVMAIDVESGKVLVRRQADMPLIPASNLKLLTVAAALAGLGPEGRFTTNFEAVGEVHDGVLEGDLVVRAGGDPLYQRNGFGRIDRWLDPLAEDLKKAGIQRVAGALVLDEGTWLEPGPGPEWPAPSEFWKDYCALAAGFTVNGGSFRATVTPRPESGKVDVVLAPKHHGLKRRGSVKLGSRNAVNVGANASGVTVKGTIPASVSVLVSEFAAPDPVDLFGHAFVGGLADRGLAIEGGFVRTHGFEKNGPVVHSIRTPITDVFAPILEDSHNAIADQLFLSLGAQIEGAGTRQAASKAVKDALEKIGVAGRELVQVDGSGLSKANRTTAIQLVALVAAVVKTGGATAQAFLDALPVAGESGTLSKRMSGTPAEGRVRAKTGWVSGASSLSGVAQTQGGRLIVFSILVGYPRIGGLNPTVWKPMQDEICVALVGWNPAEVR
ncbi:D-alanyl-D-alanine carboxypeptidase DacC precursor [Planctomycetes bacterium Poly30]|uniref:D-alanyl-D-alanine carboxypeptidase DacC n=1 Tax=Saltatorellus ferox TaxID=2528018 RepID=A0A518ETH5_9BACT|nr:D-alanyl-D-alanine carboxypeptidase DacC precursor [Planctomycetes bacterium Poly30]